MKQLLGLAHLRGKTASTNEATWLALLLAWALLHPEVAHARHVLKEAAEQWQRAHCQPDSSAPSPTPSPPTVSSWTVTALAVQTLRQLVQGFWTFARLHSCLPYLQRFLSSRRRQRQHQESTSRRQLLVHLAPTAASSSLFFFCSSA